MDAFVLDRAVTRFGREVDERLARTRMVKVPTLPDPGKRHAYVPVPAHTLAEVLGIEEPGDDIGLGDAEVEELAASLLAGPVDWGTWGVE